VADLINVRQQELAEFCRRNGIRKLALFGSLLTSHLTDASDIDGPVEFEPGVHVGDLRMAALEQKLSDLFGGRKIDLRTPAERAGTSAMRYYERPPFSTPLSDVVCLRYMLDAARKMVHWTLSELALAIRVTLRSYNPPAGI